MTSPRCTSTSETIECRICGPGQGIGPVLTGKYGSASFTMCFQSIVFLSVILILLISWILWRRKKARWEAAAAILTTTTTTTTNSNSNSNSKRSSSLLKLPDGDDGEFSYSLIDEGDDNDDLDIDIERGGRRRTQKLSPQQNTTGNNPSSTAAPTTLAEGGREPGHLMTNFAEEKKGEESNSSSRFNLNNKTNDDLKSKTMVQMGVEERGSEVFRKAVNFALKKEMKDLEGKWLPRSIILVSFILFFLSSFVPFSTDIEEMTMINFKENSNWIVLAANAPVPLAWLYIAVAFTQNHLFETSPLHWLPTFMGFMLWILQLFQGYNFVVPYIVGGVSVPFKSFTAVLLICNVFFTTVFSIMASLNTWRQRSSPLFLLNAETNAFIALEKQRKNGTKPYIRLLTLCKVDYLLFVFGCLGGLFATLSNIGWQICFGRMLHSVISQDKDALVAAIRLQVLSCVALYLGNSMQLCFVEAAGTRLVTRIQRFVFTAMVEQDMSFYDKNKSGELTTMLTSNTGLIRTGMTTQLAQAFRGCFQFVIILIYLLINNLDLTLVFFGTALVPLVILACSLALISGLSNKSAEAQNKQGGMAQEFLSGIRTVVSFVMQEGAKKVYDKAAWYSNAIGVRLVVVQGLAFSVVFGGFYGALTVALWYGCNDIMTKGAHDPSYVASQTPSLVIFIQMAIAMVMGLGWIIGGLPEVAKAVGASKRLFEILDRQPLVNYCGGKKLDDGSVRGNIAMEGIKFVYPTREDKVVLENFNLTISEGETVALVGQSGSGKSTVLGMIERFYDPVEGSVRLDGVDLRILDPMWLRQKIGFVMQEPTLFAGTISENIRFGSEWVSDEVMVDAAKQANAHNFISGLPSGYDTVVGENGTSLSGGQKQRIAIARAILKDPKILLLDEATSALDAKSEQLVQDALDKLMHGRTTVVVAHRLTTIENADKIHVFHEGKIAESGTHSSLLRKNGIYANLINKQRGSSYPNTNFSLGSVHTPRLNTSPPNLVSPNNMKRDELLKIKVPLMQSIVESPFTAAFTTHPPPSGQKVILPSNIKPKPPLHRGKRSRSAGNSPTRGRKGSDEEREVRNRGKSDELRIKTPLMKSRSANNSPSRKKKRQGSLN